MLQSVKNASLVGLLVLCSISASAQTARASGYALFEQSVKGLGNAFAGSAATAEDASTIFYNPAGLTELSGFQVQNGAHFIIPVLRFTNSGSRFVTGSPIPGSEGGDAGAEALVPNLYASWDLSESIKAGIGINVPFGLQTKYDNDWVGRYQGINSKLLTINVNPSIAAKLSDQFSIGLGANLRYAKAELSNAVDLGLIGSQQLAGTPFAAGFAPGSADGLAEIEGEDWSLGVNIGALYKPNDGTKIGLAFRSGMRHTLKGSANFTVPDNAAILTRSGSFTDTEAEAVLRTPATVALSGSQKLTEKLTLLGDATWTNWSRFEELRIDFANPAQPAVVKAQNWKDTIRLSLGLNYAASDRLLLRAGFAFDPTPTRDEFRTVRIPDSDRTWYTIGATYKASDKFSLDVGYAYINVDRTSINESSAAGGTIVGDYRGSINILSAQARWQF
ncbi:outer membrane protein transport protein [filamentous cyanobacterium LEGE 11480]|uniref:Outer membrane protein transport protein n=1 Tax=Romeriopsis navalis LEGE 11480 TaxID=2777977 RepID=A0A928VR36_9CYAN|nr:outer membrane protein transport protein [Romeriopsis navalis]MBE9030997.1 outer membrane protein transport protein [Romeriopsis navalis LEGE 11480]